MIVQKMIVQSPDLSLVSLCQLSAKVFKALVPLILIQPLHEALALLDKEVPPIGLIWACPLNIWLPVQYLG